MAKGMGGVFPSVGCMFLLQFFSSQFNFLYFVVVVVCPPYYYNVNKTHIIFPKNFLFGSFNGLNFMDLKMENTNFGALMCVSLHEIYYNFSVA